MCVRISWRSTAASSSNKGGFWHTSCYAFSQLFFLPMSLVPSLQTYVSVFRFSYFKLSVFLLIYFLPFLYKCYHFCGGLSHSPDSHVSNSNIASLNYFFHCFYRFSKSKVCHFHLWKTFNQQLLEITVGVNSDTWANLMGQ